MVEKQKVKTIVIKYYRDRGKINLSNKKRKKYESKITNNINSN